MLMLRAASHDRRAKSITIECATSPGDITYRLSSLKTMMPTRHFLSLIGSIPRRKGGDIMTACSIASFITTNDSHEKRHPTQRGGRSQWDIDYSRRRRSKELERHSL